MTPESFPALMGLVALSVAVIAALAVSANTRHARRRNLAQEVDLQKLRDEVRLMRVQERKYHVKQRALEKVQMGQAEKYHELLLEQHAHHQSSGERELQYAIEMARKGATPGELMATAEIDEAEARLVTKLYRGKRH